MNDRSNPLLKIVCSNPNINGSKQLRFIQKKGLHRFSVSSIDGQVCGQSGDLSPQDIRQQFVIKTFTSVTRCSLDEVDIYQNSRTQERKSRILDSDTWHLGWNRDLGVCAIFPFVIFIQFGERNDNGLCGGKSCEHFNEVNVRNLRK